MDTKITLAFDEGVIANAKKFAEEHHISLSRLTEFLYRKITAGDYQELEELPIADWVHMVSEGPSEYHTSRSRKDVKKDFYEKR